MYKHKNVLAASIFFISLFISGCVSIGPFLDHQSARTIGDGNHNIIGGYSTIYVPTFKYNYGLSENSEIGVFVEIVSNGFVFKYAFINNQETELSFASSLGAGESIGGPIYFGDIRFSYLVNKFEPYIAISGEASLIFSDSFGEVFLASGGMTFTF